MSFLVNADGEQGIFISHSTANKNIAERLCEFIGAIGVNKRQVFCSSIVGQGVDNGEKLNDRIAKSLKESKVIIFLLSSAFFDSYYCIEELGVGWYLAENSVLKSYFLLLPDILDLSEIKGFVNSKIDKFSFLNRKEDLHLLALNLCNELGLHAPKDTVIADAEIEFIHATEPLFKDLVDERVRRELEKEKKETKIERLKSENNQLQDEVERLIDTLMQEREQSKLQLLEKEYHAIENDFNHFGGQSGITKQKFKEEGEEFWLSMVSRYLCLRKQLQELGCPRLYHQNIEILIATIYSAHGDLGKSYEHIKNYFLYVRGSIYPSVFTNIVFDDENDTYELIEIIKDRIKNTEIGTVQDSYKMSLNYLLDRKNRLGGRNDDM